MALSRARAVTALFIALKGPYILPVPARGFVEVCSLGRGGCEQEGGPGKQDRHAGGGADAKWSRCFPQCADAALPRILPGYFEETAGQRPKDATNLQHHFCARLVYA